MAQVSYGTITITDTNDISRIYMEYCRSTKNQLSGDTVPNITRAWGETTPPWVDGEYIWQRAVVEKSGTLEKTYGTPVCISGEKGETGQQGPQGGTGAAGRSLDSTETKYAQVAANSTEAQVKALIESRWTLNVPSYNSSLPEYWVRVTNVYSNPTETQKIYYKDNGITDAVKTSAEANTTAGQAKTQAAAAEGKADSAASTANSANTKATNALNIANGTSQHFWWIAEDTSTTGGTISAGAYITDIAKDTFKTNPSGYGNLLLRSDGVYLNVGLQTLASFKSDALTFYNSAGTELGKFGSTGLEMSGTLNIKGGGRIGQDSDNYWEFGDNKSYNDEDSAYLIGRGTASIQLGETGHWRLDKNRIHAGWYQLDDKSNSTPAGSLHFDTGADGNATYYWDYGMHYPDKAGNGNNKFLYIRRSNDTTSTTLSTMKGRIDDDTWWTYKFYIDGNGNVHAPGFYIGDSTTPIGGGAGTVAERLTQGYGSTTQPIYIQSNGVPAAIDYTIQSSVPQNAVFTALSTSNPGYVAKAPNSTSQFLRGDATWAAVTKSNVGLGNVENVALSSWAGSSSLTTTKVGTLAEAATRGVDTSISATSTSTKLPTSAAVANLVKQYLPLTGGNVTGAVTFGSSVSADELTVGDLVVNGTASFTNNLQVNTINGVAVGSNPKFTDTVTTVTVTGSGNAITGASASGGAVTLTKGTTFPTGSGTNGYLTKWTGTNTIGNGPALGSDTTKFLNNKGEWAVPAGTGLTSVGASGSGGITISGSPITTSGTIAIGLNLSTAINGLGEGASPATREDYIVAQYAGGGTTTTSYHRRKLSNIFAALNSSDITTALGYTPYNATNPNGYTSNTGTVTSIATSSPITGGTITGSGTIGHATSGVGNAVTTAGLYKFKYDTYGHITGVSAIAKADITGLGIPAQDTTYSNASTTTAGLMSAADKKKLDNIQVDSSGQAVAANVAGRWGIDVTFNSNNVAQVGHANSAITASNTQAAKTTASVTSTQLAFGDVINFPYVAYDTYGHITSKTNLYFKMPAAPSSTGTADAFSSAATIALTGDTTGSASSTKGWSITTTTDRATVTYCRDDANANANKELWNVFRNGTTGAQPGKVRFFSVYGADTSKAPTTYGEMIEITHANSNHYQPQLWFGPGKAGSLYHRNKEYNNDSWGAWHTILDTSNYTSYTVKKDGTGASGTWGISISGNAATASSATNATYATYDADEVSNTAKVTIANKYVKKAGDTMTGTLTVPVLQTGTAATNYFQSQKFRGQGTADSYYHAIDFGYASHDRVDFYEYGGIFCFHKHTGEAINSGDTILGTITTNGWEGNVVGNVTGNASTSTKATQDSDGNIITSSYLRRFSWWSSGDTHNIDDLRNGITFAYGNNHNGPTTGTVVAFDCSTNTSYTLQLMGSYNGDDLYFRNHNGDNNTWRNWNKIIHNNNYTDYTVTKTGTGASGTWGISITGTAAKATADASGNTITSTYVKKAGDTMTGVLTMLGNQYNDSYSGALNMNNSNIYGVNSIYTADYSDNSQEGIHFYRDSTHVDTIHAAGGVLYFTPNRALGSNGTSYTILHTGNYTSTLNNKYVTIDTDQTITASQKTFTGATRWGSASKYGAVHYDTSLEALVFSFA